MVKDHLTVQYPDHLALGHNNLNTGLVRYSDGHCTTFLFLPKVYLLLLNKYSYLQFIESYIESPLN
jgi:hypothetical protein